jgi:AraC-like DNA-binding protein
MELDKLVQAYFDAWNAHDTAALLAFFHKDASYHDAFWMETCMAEDLAQYLDDSFDLEQYWYQQSGALITVGDGVVFRYSAHDQTDKANGPAVFTGAIVFVFRDNKIFSVSDVYCNPNPAALKELARWSMRHHGRLRNMRFGLPAVMATQYRDKLSALMEQDRVFLDPNLTLSEVANRLGCSVDHLTEVVTTEFGASFYSFLDRYRATYAKDLLMKESTDPDYLYEVAAQSGFRSVERFNRAFKNIFRVRPADFHPHKSK